MKKLDLILIDSFQKDYYQYSPFLSRLKEKNISADLLPIIGYQQHLASLFSGSYPQEINAWNTFNFSPKTSIFRWLKPFVSFKILDYKFLKYLIDFISYVAAGVNDMMPVRIPIKIAHNFDIVLRRPITAKDSLVKPNIFNLFRENKIRFSYFKGGLKYADKDKNKVFLPNLVHLISRSDCRTIKNALKSSADFKFIYLMQLDHISHKFGVDSPEVRAKVKEIGELLRNYLAKSNRPFIIVSDHGMVKVKGSVDVISPINEMGLVLGKDYLVFAESVLASFWFFNGRAREKISGMLGRIKEGHILSKEERQEFGIDFKDSRFGDLIFILDSGWVINPNYYQEKNAAKAMHGYLPVECKGIFLTNLDIKIGLNQPVNFIDIIPTVADFFGLAKIGVGESLFKEIYSKKI